MVAARAAGFPARAPLRFPARPAARRAVSFSRCQTANLHCPFCWCRRAAAWHSRPVDRGSVLHRDPHLVRLPDSPAKGDRPHLGADGDVGGAHRGARPLPGTDRLQRVMQPRPAPLVVGGAACVDIAAAAVVAPAASVVATAPASQLIVGKAQGIRDVRLRRSLAPLALFGCGLRSFCCGIHSHSPFRSRGAIRVRVFRSWHPPRTEGRAERRDGANLSRLRGATNHACEAWRAPGEVRTPLGAPPWRFLAGVRASVSGISSGIRPASSSQPGHCAWRAGSRASRVRRVRTGSRRTPLPAPPSARLRRAMIPFLTDRAAVKKPSLPIFQFLRLFRLPAARTLSVQLLTLRL